jgi:hypothetical protein
MTRTISEGSPDNGTVYCAACNGEIEPERACAVSAAGVYLHITAKECAAVVAGRRS